MAARADSKRKVFAPQMRVGRPRLDPARQWYRMEAVGDAAAPRATLDIFGYIGQDTDPWSGEKVGISAETLLTQLRALPANCDLDVTINSRGGDPFDGCAMHAFLSAHQGKVTVTIAGIAASAATLVAMAGDEIRMPANAWFMIHNPSCGAYGTTADLQAAITELTSIRDGGIAAYAAGNRAGMTAEAIGAAMDAETWYTGQQALDAGWIDTLVEPVAATMLAAHRDEDLPLDTYGNVPAELALADVVEASPPPAPEAEIVAQLRAQVAEMQARLAAEPPVAEQVAEVVPAPADERTPEQVAEQAAAAEAARLAAEASEQAAQAAMAADRELREHARRQAVMHGLTESFDGLVAIGATTQQLTDLVIRGAVARAGMVDVASHAEPPVPTVKAAPKQALDPDKYYALLNNRPKPGSK